MQMYDWFDSWKGKEKINEYFISGERKSKLSEYFHCWKGKEKNVSLKSTLSVYFTQVFP